MAAIDKCYVDSYADYKTFCDWAKDRSFITPRGAKVVISDYIFNWKEEDFKDGCVPIFNSPVIFDNYLYHNCNLSFIREWLASRYTNNLTGDLYDEITQVPTLPEFVPCRHVSVLKNGIGNMPYKSYNDYSRRKYGYWIVDIYLGNSTCWYNEEYDFWTIPFENDIHTASYAAFKNKSIKSIIRRIIKKWKLPVGCKIEIEDRTTKWVLITK